MAGTLLELVALTGGNETEIVAVLEAGWTLTGNFKGHEAEILAELAEEEIAEAA